MNQVLLNKFWEDWELGESMQVEIEPLHILIWVFVLVRDNVLRLLGLLSFEVYFSLLIVWSQLRLRLIWIPRYLYVSLGNRVLINELLYLSVSSDLSLIEVYPDFFGLILRSVSWQNSLRISKYFSICFGDEEIMQISSA